MKAMMKHEMMLARDIDPEPFRQTYVGGHPVGELKPSQKTMTMTFHCYLISNHSTHNE